MTAEHFDQVLAALRDQRPYHIFTVELNGGERLEIDHPGAIIIRDGVAVFLEPGGRPNYFDHDSVNKILVGSENASL